jgi:hypothetical protein
MLSNLVATVSGLSRRTFHSRIDTLGIPGIAP